MFQLPGGEQEDGFELLVTVGEPLPPHAPRTTSKTPHTTSRRRIGLTPALLVRASPQVVHVASGGRATARTAREPGAARLPSPSHGGAMASADYPHMLGRWARSRTAFKARLPRRMPGWRRPCPRSAVSQDSRCIRRWRFMTPWSAPNAQGAVSGQAGALRRSHSGRGAVGAGSPRAGPGSTVGGLLGSGLVV